MNRTLVTSEAQARLMHVNSMRNAREQAETQQPGSSNMTAPSLSNDRPTHAAFDDAFEVLDACHQRILIALDTMSALLARLDTAGTDAQARSMASELLTFFSTTVRQHHEDEERHIFPRLVIDSDAATVQAVL